TSTITVCATALLAMSVALMASGGADTDVRRESHDGMARNVDRSGLRLTERERPRPWEVRGSRAVVSPRFWRIVIPPANAICAVWATASNSKSVPCDISAERCGRWYLDRSTRG